MRRADGATLVGELDLSAIRPHQCGLGKRGAVRQENFREERVILALGRAGAALLKPCVLADYRKIDVAGLCERGKRRE